jgi:thymidylate synthase
MYNRPSIYKDYKRDGMHDMICTLMSQFFIRKIDDEDRLFMVHYMRSNDVRYGFICSDLAWNCFVYQNMYEDLKETYPNLKTGFIKWTSNSMHIYERHFQDLKNLFESESEFDVLCRHRI